MAILDRMGRINFWYVRSDTTVNIHLENGQDSRCSVDLHILVHNFNLLFNPRSLYQKRGLYHRTIGQLIN